MAAAFGTFDEPHAWLIRGLVEYGWPDTSRAGGYVPPGVFGAIDLSRLSEKEGRYGVVLDIPAVAQGHKFDEDGIYHFQAQVIRSQDTGQLAFCVRCPEANFMQEFPYDPANPTWAAGYIHQALSQYVPQFVVWRRAGGEVTWVQRQSIIELDGEPCSGPLSGFIADGIRAGHKFDRGPAEGWWMGRPTLLSATAAPAARPAGGPVPAFLQRGTGAAPGLPTPPIAAARPPGPAGSAPVLPAVIAGGPIATMGQGIGGARSPEIRARALADKPGLALMVIAGLGMVQGATWFINAISIQIWYKEEIFAMVFSILVSMMLVPVGAVAAFGAWKYRKGERHILSGIAIAYAALVPVCCVAGIPIAGWALWTWRDEAFKRRA